MNKATVATGSAFGASVLSALTASCCVAPALLAVFGLSATVAMPLTYLEPYRSYFTAVGALCLTAAGGWIYGRRSWGAAGTYVPPTQRRTRLFFWFAVAAFLAATFHPYLVTS